MQHYDFVQCPDGTKRKIFSVEDIDKLLSEWGQYCEANWVSSGKKMFDPESKIKYMLDGIGNILLRNHMDGILTEYKKMKMGVYEIPLSACASILSDEVYSERPKIDNGEEEQRMQQMVDELAQKYEDMKASKESHAYRESKTKKQKKIFPRTRRQKIEDMRKKYGIVSFSFVRVDTQNVFTYKNKYYKINDDVAQYQGKQTLDGDMIYDMDQIICAETSEGDLVFFDMNIEPITNNVAMIGEQINFF